MSLHQARLPGTSYGTECGSDTCYRFFVFISVSQTRPRFFSNFSLNEAFVSIENLQYNDLFADLPVSADILNTLTLFDFVPENARFDTPILTFQFRKFIGESEKIKIDNLPQPIRLEMPRTPNLSLANRTVEVIKPRESMILSFNTTKYISMQIRTDERPRLVTFNFEGHIQIYSVLTIWTKMEL